ncbi:thiol-disulfide oxidoreductase DCC family protein [Neorhizobium alkalisoli]|uniref:thiol-disulfide oxidoreductase DCC family protein n=1 Tax=Neorhizobium alkalisoli TaxID=528178 RepID=UPI000CF86380|nr:thiol-disulfide oxidoreductase DCC family protein [Neorhizobium alkalisoli]
MIGQSYSYRHDPAVPGFDDTVPVIIFDGDCVFCSRWVKFLLQHDRRGRYRFLTAQSPLGTALYRHYGLETRNYETNLLLDGGRPYFKSEATLQVLGSLGMPWSLMRLLFVLPLPVRDRAYDLIARNRYRIAGRRSSCFVPTAAQKHRFIG